MKTNNNISIILKRYLSNRFPKETEEHVQKWIIAKKNLKEKEEASLDYWNELETVINRDTYSALARVNRKIGYAGRQILAIPFYRKALRIVAVLVPLIFIMGGYFYYTQQKLTEISVAYGETKHIFLPDSSEIWINAGSNIKYPKAFTANQRLVYLEGEAYFSVKKNQAKPFIVKTEQLSVRVLGTKFNVKAYPDASTATATLTSGKVEVCTPNRQHKTLKPNEQLTYNINTSSIDIENISPAETDAWLSGQLLFINSSFKEMIQTLERHFNITIENRTNIPASKLYTVKFLKGESPEEILNVLKDVVGFTYRQQGTTIILNN